MCVPVERSISPLFQVPIVIPIIVMVISALLVVTPIASNPQLGYIYALCFIFAGLFFYVPFVYYKKVLPGLGESTMSLRLGRQRSVDLNVCVFCLFVCFFFHRQVD